LGGKGLGIRDAALIEKIENLKRSKNAVILAHNFQPPEIQDIADFVGDSWEIPLKAQLSNASVVVVCGVDDIADTVFVLSPEKTVLLPELNATCPLCGMISVERLREKKKEYPKAKVVCYIKSPAEVKAEADICCTSDNAIDIVRSLERCDRIIFVPDQYLGDDVCLQTGLDLVLWPGYCPSQIKINPEDIQKLKAEHPQAKTIVHPQCTPQVKALADAVIGTRAMIDFVSETNTPEIIVASEVGLVYRLKKENAGKTFFAASDSAICGKMKRITLENLLWSLESNINQVKVPEAIRQRAKIAIDKMLEVQRASSFAEGKFRGATKL
jgi:quinolinate synthase